MTTGVSTHPFAKELNELQDATMLLLSTVRDEVDRTFRNSGQDKEVLQTLKQLFHYMSERSQAVSYLVSSGFPWDAEIILRSCYEASAKIWFICFEGKSERTALIQEFWGLYAATHDHKRKHRIVPARNLSKQRGREGSAAIFDGLVNEAIFPASSTNKRTRRDIEQKWSFTEIINSLSDPKNNEMKVPNADVLLHMYGQQSHLIHADDAALGLILDRALRNNDELPILEASHAARIMSDQGSLGVLSVGALRHMHGVKELIPFEVAELWSNQTKCSESLFNQFYDTQRDFYETHTS
jgi:hypothetical protein